jgi:hypothetical protein
MNKGKHTLCITIDTDPDDLNQFEVNRDNLRWDGLDYLLPRLESILTYKEETLPITWFLRVDNQIADFHDTPAWLYDHYQNYWERFLANSHEIAWHPHLYSKKANGYEIMDDPIELKETMFQLWEYIISIEGLSIKVFRNGEGWIAKSIFEVLKEIGLQIDSTGLPGIYRTDGHPLNWKKATNAIYYPDFEYPDCKGTQKEIVEFPMSTWEIQASYDKAKKRRYLNPAIHHALFKAAVTKLDIGVLEKQNYWNFIFHPAEIFPQGKEDLLYSLSLEELTKNIRFFAEHIENFGYDVEFKTITSAVNSWMTNE